MAEKTAAQRLRVPVPENLSSAQVKAAEMIALNDVHGLTLAEIAQEVGISERTLYRWKSNPEFIEYMNELAENLMEEFISEAYWRIRELARRGKEQTRLKALELALKNRGKLRDVEEKTVEVKDERSSDAIKEEIEALKAQLGDV